MAYSLEMVPEVRSFLFACPNLTRTDRVRLFDLLNVLRDQGDTFRAEASRRLSPDSEHFLFDVVLLSTAGQLRTFRFVVSDASATYGVLRIVYGDEG